MIPGIRFNADDDGSVPGSDDHAVPGLWLLRGGCRPPGNDLSLPSSVLPHMSRSRVFMAGAVLVYYYTSS